MLKLIKPSYENEKDDAISEPKMKFLQKKWRKNYQAMNISYGKNEKIDKGKSTYLSKRRLGIILRDIQAIKNGNYELIESQDEI